MWAGRFRGLMTSVVRKLEGLRLVELREILRSKGLSTRGTKAELTDRLRIADPGGDWLRVAEETDLAMAAASDRADGEVTMNDVVEDSERLGERGVAAFRREIELERRGRKLLERELLLARRELELLRMERGVGAADAGRLVIPAGSERATSMTSSSAVVSQTKVSIV